MYSIGIDIGGTQARVALVDPQMNIVEKKTTPTAKRELEDVLEDLIKLIKEVDPQEKAQVVGIASAGPLDIEKGIILDAPNLINWAYKPFASVIRERTRLPSFLTNDANAAALAQDIGNKTYDCLMFITVSTGIGGGIVYKHQLIEGRFGYAGEVGAMIISEEDRNHLSLYKGSWESLCSGTALGLRASQLYNKKMDAKDLFSLYYEKDPLAIKIIDEWAEYFSRAIANLLQIIEPEIFYIGGSVFIHNPFLLELIEEKTKDKVYDGLRDKIRLELPNHEEDAGIIGSAYHAKNRLKG